jgi:hypothetical protein
VGAGEWVSEDESSVIVHLTDSAWQLARSCHSVSSCPERAADAVSTASLRSAPCKCRACKTSGRWWRHLWRTNTCTFVKQCWGQEHTRTHIHAAPCQHQQQHWQGRSRANPYVKYDPLAFGVGKDDPAVAAAATAMIGTIHMAACVYVCVCACVAVCRGRDAGIQECSGKCRENVNSQKVGKK